MRSRIPGLRNVFYGWIIVVVAAVGTCTGFGTIYSFSVFFKYWIGEFGSSRAALSGIFSVAFIIYGLASIFPLATVELFGVRAMGSLFGISLLGATIGGSAGPLLAGFTFDMTRSYFTAFGAGAISLTIAILLATGIRKRA